MKKTISFILLLLLSSHLSYSGVTDTNRMWGVTIDAVGGLNAVVTSLQNLCKKPTTRIVFDEFIPASDYVNAVNQIHNVSFIMGELLDSYYMNQYSLAQYVARTNEYVNLLGSKVDIWEIGNEINGEWLGNTADVVAKMDTAYSIVKAQNKKTELTLYYNQDCWSNPKNEMFYWVNKNVSTKLRNGLDYVLVSYYEDDCNGLQPNWQKVFDSLHVLFPNSKLGIGECGTVVSGKKAAYINRYYKMNITTPNYIGGYFWWYYKQDCVPYTNALWTTLNNAFSNSAIPTSQASQISYLALTSNSVQIDWTNGNGTSRAVFLSEGVAGIAALTDGYTYTANSIFGLGSQAGAGWYCVYKGTGSSVTVSGLSPGTTYRVMVSDFNGNPGFEGYNKNTAVNNPVNIQSAMPVHLLYFNFAVEENAVRLKWATGKEVNNSGFTVERASPENPGQWINAGFVKGRGNVEFMTTYEFIDKNLAGGKYRYRIKQTDLNGNFEYFNLNGEVCIGAPEKFGLSQNYPNPFNNTSVIKYKIPNSGEAVLTPENVFIEMKVFDVTGKAVHTLVKQNQTPGYYEVKMTANHLSSGLYIYTLSADGMLIDAKKFALIK
ncbi:MAG: T9SS type A sorting domain-containing protein [Ignavibacteriae bacterium]|nr:T9SS type A sorting domain-containing protein [Ignavibacteriota bacterium]